MSKSNSNSKNKVRKPPSELLAKAIKRGERLRSHLQSHGLWLSLVERLVRDQEAVGSNPTSPTISIRDELDRLLVAW